MPCGPTGIGWCSPTSASPPGRVDPGAFVDAAVEANLAAGPLGPDDQVVVVGHSGAGVLLPSIAMGLATPRRAIVFVDAGLPPYEGATSVGGAFLTPLRRMAVGGVVPRWSTWWGAGAMAALVADEHRRAEIEAQLEPTPLAFFEAPVDVPAGWYDLPLAYVRFGATYRREADIAASWGWPVVEHPGTHLAIVNEPEAVARIVVDLSR